MSLQISEILSNASSRPQASGGRNFVFGDLETREGVRRALRTRSGELAVAGRNFLAERLWRP